VHRNIVHIESLDKNNRNFGTGFIIDKDDKGVYILTCKHVIDDVVNPMVEEVKARIIAMGDEIDMAVIYVSKLHVEPLVLQVNTCKSLEVEIIGFSNFNQNMTQKKHISASLYDEKIELHANQNDFFYYIRKIKADEGYSFDRGNSGSPVFCKDSNRVIAMISNKEGTEIGYAIEINSLQQVWKEMPSHLLDQDTLPIEPVSGIQNTKVAQNTQQTKPLSSNLPYLITLTLVLFISLSTYFIYSAPSTNHANLLTSTEPKLTPDMFLEHTLIAQGSSPDNAHNHNCVDIDYTALRIKKENDHFILLSHANPIFAFKHSRGAYRAEFIIQHYQMTQSCFLGREEINFGYLLSSGQLPIGPLENEECIGFSYKNISIEYRHNHYVILSEGYPLLHFSHKNEAQEAFNILKEYQANHFCYVRNPKSNFKYFKQ